MDFEFLEITVIVLLSVVVLLLKWSDGPLAPRSTPQAQLLEQSGQQGLEASQDSVAAVAEEID